MITPRVTEIPKPWMKPPFTAPPAPGAESRPVEGREAPRAVETSKRSPDRTGHAVSPAHDALPSSTERSPG